jgi:hypothetical protein
MIIIILNPHAGIIPNAKHKFIETTKYIVNPGSHDLAERHTYNLAIFYGK